VRPAQYMASYRGRLVDFESVAVYFWNKIGAIH
jgi:hypothetical protein